MKFKHIISFTTCIIIFIAGYGQSSPLKKTAKTGNFSSGILNEVSGIAASGLHKDIFYVHNDSGDSSRFFAITRNGQLMATYYFKGVARNRFGVIDCEDIAVGPGPVKGRSYIYLADIGDNIQWRLTVQIYRFEEPSVIRKGTDTLQADVLDIVYPDGPHDAEALMIDPRQKELYIISKRDDSPGIYHCSLLFNDKDKVRMKLSGRLSSSGWIVSGDISRDGRKILLKSAKDVFYWKRRSGEPIYNTLLGPATRQKNYVFRSDEEAITFTPNGTGYFTAGEGRMSAIYYYDIE